MFQRNSFHFPSPIHLWCLIVCILFFKNGLISSLLYQVSSVCHQHCSKSSLLRTLNSLWFARELNTGNRPGGERLKVCCVRLSSCFSFMCLGKKHLDCVISRDRLVVIQQRASCSSFLISKEAVHIGNAHRCSVHRSDAYRSSVHRSSVHRNGEHGSSVHRSGVYRISVHRSSVHRSGAHRSSMHRSSVHRSSAHRSSAHRSNVHRISAHRSNVF